MKEGSGWRIAVGVVLVVALIAAGAALAWMAYNAGAAQTAAPGAVAPLGVTAYRPHYMAPFGFGFVGCLVPLAFLFLVFGLFRFVVWGGMRRHMMHEGWGPRGWGTHDGMREHWQQRMDEWHREAHTGGGETPADKRSA